MNTISNLILPADLLPVLNIEQQCHTTPWSKKTLLSNQGDHYFNLKISVAKQLVGFAITQVIADEATLFNLAIAPNYQRQGLGRTLLQYLIEQLRKQQKETLWLEVRASNARAIYLYQQLGFNTVTTRRDYYPAPHGREDAFVMACYLFDEMNRSFSSV